MTAGDSTVTTAPTVESVTVESTTVESTTVETVAILGATGSIGASALDVIGRHPGRYRVAGLSANTGVDALRGLCAKFKPELAVLADESAAGQLARELAGGPTRVLGGPAAVEELAAAASTVICGIVGAAGLQPALAAVRAGKKVLIANKEPLVMLGGAHPNWSMGKKVSVDSATMMNKGLELLEARALFAVDEREVDIVVHPQSVVHSLVEFADGSVLAQLGPADMRVAIAHALGWPRRIASGARGLSLTDCARLDFEPPDHRRFPCLALARAAARAGGTVPAAMNAANEVAVEAFLTGRLSFDRIAAAVETVLARDGDGDGGDCTVEAALAADAEARRRCEEYLRAAPVTVAVDSAVAAAAH